MAKGSQRTTSFVFFCVVIALAVYFMLNPFKETMPFKAEVWKKDAKHQKMARYIVEEDLLKDKTLSQTIEMLGEPDDRRTDTSNKTILSYKLRGGDDPRLVVEIDSTQVFSTARIIED